MDRDEGDSKGGKEEIISVLFGQVVSAFRYELQH